jgi:hypothetical protein
MCNFIIEKVTPVVLGLFGISCIDLPQNYVRTALLLIVDAINEHFSQVFQSLL